MEPSKTDYHGDLGSKAFSSAAQEADAQNIKSNREDFEDRIEEFSEG